VVKIRRGWILLSVWEHVSMWMFVEGGQLVVSCEVQRFAAPQMHGNLGCSPVVMPCRNVGIVNLHVSCRCVYDRTVGEAHGTCE
jgi:hypothetical protein